MGELIQLSSFRDKQAAIKPKLAPKAKTVTTAKRPTRKSVYDEVMIAHISSIKLLTSKLGQEYLLASATIVDDVPYVEHETGVWVCWNTHADIAKTFKKYLALLLGEHVEAEFLKTLTYLDVVELLDLLLKGRFVVRVIRAGRKSFQKCYITEPSPHYVPVEKFTAKWEALKAPQDNPQILINLL